MEILFFDLSLFGLFPGGSITAQLNALAGSNIPWPYQDISQFIMNIVNVAVIVAGVGSFALLLYGGIRYITSAGDKLGTQHAREVITAAIIGLIIVVGSYATATTLGTIMGFNPMNFVIPEAPRRGDGGGGGGGTACCAGNRDCEWAGTKAPSCLNAATCVDWSCWTTHLNANPCDEMPWKPACCALRGPPCNLSCEAAAGC